MPVDVRELPAIARRAAADLEGAPALDVLGWAETTFGSAWCVTSSMADAVLPHLAARVRPGVDVIFLDTGYHFAETIGTRDAVAATLPVTGAQHPAQADGRRAGCRVRRRTVRARPRPLLRLAQGRPARRRPGSLPGVGNRAATRRGADPRERRGGRMGRVAIDGQAEPHRHVVAGRRRRVYRGARRLGQSAAVRRLRLGGLRAVYPARRRGARTHGPDAGRAPRRSSAACTADPPFAEQPDDRPRRNTSVAI